MAKKEKKRLRDFSAQQIGMLLCTVLVAVVFLVSGSYGLWRLTCKVDVSILAVWALLATVLLPVGVWAGVRWGSEGARGVVHGLDLGINHAMDAANRAADLKVTMHRAVRTPAPQPDLPPLPRIERRRALGDGEVIDV